MALSGLPYHSHYQFATTAEMFPSRERFEGARQAILERATFRSTRTSSTSGEAPRSVRSLSLEPDDESADKKAFTHFMEKHVMSSSIVPVRHASGGVCSAQRRASCAMASPCRALPVALTPHHRAPVSLFTAPWSLQLPSKSPSSVSALSQAHSTASGRSKR